MRSPLETALAKSSTVRTLRDEASHIIAAATDEVERHKRMHKNGTALKRGLTENGEICEIAGVGPIPVATATEYSGEAFLKLLVIDGTDIKTIAHMGHALPAKLRTGVEESDRVCQVPTCDVTLGLEIDHIKPFAEGGATSFENLVRLCRSSSPKNTRRIQAQENRSGDD